MKLTALCIFTAAYAATSTLAHDLKPAAAASHPSLPADLAPKPTIPPAEEYAVLE
jgi:hypothetical protein